jgi:hypothetical protein
VKHLIALIYKIGFRPKAGSTFYSPSLHWKYWGQKAIEQATKHLRRK